jgi:hypothetical protein
MDQEREFLAAIGSATTWSIERDVLDIHRADGQRALMAKRMESGHGMPCPDGSAADSWTALRYRSPLGLGRRRRGVAAEEQEAGIHLLDG